jgi:transcriptional regulator with XRE-family HTH domain
MRQSDVAEAAGVSQTLISLIERGHLATLSTKAVRRVFEAVEARFEGTVTWRGGAVDRIIDERHAQLVGQVAKELGRLGWDVHVEVTFNEYGDRGSIDTLGLNRAAGAALIVEIKTELTRVDETIRRLDVKARLAPVIVMQRFGWRPATVSRMLIVLESATNRRRVTAHEGSLGVAFPDRGPLVRRWLREPVGPLAGLRFFSIRSDRAAGQRFSTGNATKRMKPHSDSTPVAE